MANIKSSKKKNRQRVTREARNRARKTSMRTKVKKLRAAIADGKKKVAAGALKEAVAAIDRAASKGAIKPNTRSRQIARLTRAAASV